MNSNERSQYSYYLSRAQEINLEQSNELFSYQWPKQRYLLNILEEALSHTVLSKESHY